MYVHYFSYSIFQEFEKRIEAAIAKLTTVNEELGDTILRPTNSFSASWYVEDSHEACLKSLYRAWDDNNENTSSSFAARQLIGEAIAELKRKPQPPFIE